MKLQFTPYAWAKILFMRDIGDTEVSGFGITSQKYPLRVEDFILLKQKCTVATTEMDDDAVADFAWKQVDLGRHPETFSRIWIHTHPGNSPSPSGTDEKTFAAGMSDMAWSVMFIVAKGGQTYARLQYSRPKFSAKLETEIEFNVDFPSSEQQIWLAEYEENVTDLDELHRLSFKQSGGKSIQRPNNVVRRDVFPDHWQDQYGSNYGFEDYYSRVRDTDVSHDRKKYGKSSDDLAYDPKNPWYGEEEIEACGVCGVLDEDYWSPEISGYDIPLCDQCYRRHDRLESDEYEDVLDADVVEALNKPESPAIKGQR